MTDLKPLMGIRFVRASEPDCDDANRLPGPVDADGQPISQEAADAYFRALIGLEGGLTFTRAASGYWDHLAQSSTPQERLGCERLIRAAYVAAGMARHHRGAALEKANLARDDREREAMAEARALARWS